VRLWAKRKKRLKFDSGGITDRSTGEAVQLVPMPGTSAIEAEKLVFQRLGLEYIEPTLRNTG
jgi:DNA polymerase/3'-5' exonuclease PolX